jgi:hypothetical protein
MSGSIEIMSMFEVYKKQALLVVHIFHELYTIKLLMPDTYHTYICHLGL